MTTPAPPTPTTAAPLGVTAPPPAGTRPRTATVVTLWAFRVVALAQAAGMVLMPFFVGSFLEGNYPALAWHAALGGILATLTTLELGVAVLLRWPGRLPLWPAVAVLAILFLAVAQLALGYSRDLDLHLPLGVVLVGASAAVALWAWVPGRARRSARTTV